PRLILNRWIVPLDRHIDFMTLHTGMKFVIPFDMLVVFATNLNPSELLDEAFLRRIRYKIQIDRPNSDEFRQIFKAVCVANGIDFVQEVYDYLVGECYQKYGMERNACHPRDLIDHIVVDARYYKKPALLTRENMAMACENYFVTT
ncbi:MAG: ATPase, partial [Desulfuromonadaceae bacterium]